MSAFALPLPALIACWVFQLLGQQDISQKDLHANKWRILEALEKIGHNAGFLFDEGKMYLLTLKGDVLPNFISVYLKNIGKTNLRIQKSRETNLSLDEMRNRDAVGSLIRTQLTSKFREKGGKRGRYGQNIEFPDEIIFQNKFMRRGIVYPVKATLAGNLTIRVNKINGSYLGIIYISPTIKQYYQGRAGWRPLKVKFGYQLTRKRGGKDQTAAKALNRVSRPGVTNMFKRSYKIREKLGEYYFLQEKLDMSFFRPRSDLIQPEMIELKTDIDITERSLMREYLLTTIKQYGNAPLRVLVLGDEGLKDDIKPKLLLRMDKLQKFALQLGLIIQFVYSEPKYVKVTSGPNILPFELVNTSIKHTIEKVERSKYDVVLFFLSGRGDTAEKSRAYKIWDMTAVSLGPIPCQRIFSASFFYVEKDWLTVLLGMLYKARGKPIPISRYQLPFDLAIGWDLSILGKRGSQRSLVAAGISVAKNEEVEHFYEDAIILPKRSEKIATDILHSMLASLIERHHIKNIENGILFIRDGFSYGDRNAIDKIMNDMINHKLNITFQDNAILCLVEVTKTVIVRGKQGKYLPPSGSAVRISENEFILWTTNPGSKEGTNGMSQGLMIRVVYPEGISDNLMIKIAQQIYVNTFHRYTSAVKTRIPVQITVAEDLMRYIKAYFNLHKRAPKEDELPKHIMS